VYRSISSQEDEHQLQDDLDKMVTWAQTWGMRFNPAKCNTMRLTRKRNPEPTHYTMMGVNLEESDSTKYLGIKLQREMRWNQQTEYSTSKATRVLNFIRRNFYHCDLTIKDKLYNTLVRPHLDYASAAWDPHTQKNINSLERVQKRAARFITNNYSWDSSIILIMQELGWVPLQTRRKCHRLTSLYKMINGQLDVNHNDYIAPKPNRERRGYSQQFKQLAARTDAFANSFFARTSPEWNNLHPLTVGQETPASFKTHLAKDPST
jgi:hypothetical protein